MIDPKEIVEIKIRCDRSDCEISNHWAHFEKEELLWNAYVVSDENKGIVFSRSISIKTSDGKEIEIPAKSKEDREREEVGNLKRHIEDMCDTINSLNRRIDRLEEDEEDVTKEIETLRTRVKALEKDNEFKEKIIRGLEEFISDKGYYVRPRRISTQNNP